MQPVDNGIERRNNNMVTITKGLADIILDLALQDDEFDDMLSKVGMEAIMKMEWGQRKVANYIKAKGIKVSYKMEAPSGIQGIGNDPPRIGGRRCDDVRNADKDGWMPEILCPWHELTGKHTPSLRPNLVSGAFYCHGCGKKGTFTELVEYSDKVRYLLPLYIYDWVQDFKSRQGQGGSNGPVVVKSTPWDKVEDESGMETGKPLIDKLLPGGENAKLLIIGDPKAGKTTLALGIVVPASQGKPALNALEVLRPLRIGYGNFEQKGYDIKQQILRMKPIYGLPPSDMLHILEVKDLKLNNPKHAEAIMKQLAALKLDLVLFDSLYMALDDNNEPSHVKAGMKFLGDMIEVQHCALISTYHTKRSGDRGFMGRGEATVLSRFGNELERWCGSRLYYSDIADSESEYYGRLKGEIRGGIGIVDYAIAYTRVTDSAQIVPWSSVPMVRGTEIKALRRQERVRVFQQLVIAAEVLGFTRAELARALQVQDVSVHQWFHGEKAPGDDNWKAIQEVEERLKTTGRLIPG
jgi:hypothetical protein